MTQSLPVEAGEVLEFIPTSLVNTKNPPKFLLRVGTRRDRRHYEMSMIEEKMAYHGQEAFREEMIKALEALWSQEHQDVYIPMLKDYWMQVEHYLEETQEAIKSKTDLPAEIDPALSRSIKELGDRLHTAWPPLRKLAADNVAFSRDEPLLVIATIVMGWSNLDVPYDQQGIHISIDEAELIREELDDEVFDELVAKCRSRLHLSKEEAKNSESPQPSSQNQDDLKTSKDKTPGKSKEAANVTVSTSTQENSSEPSTTS